MENWRTTQSIPYVCRPIERGNPSSEGLTTVGFSGYPAAGKAAATSLEGTFLP